MDHSTRDGCRQDELLALRWEDVDLEARTLRVRHTLARVDGKLVLLPPKTARSRRNIVLPAVVVEALRGHRTRQKMERLVAGSRCVALGMDAVLGGVQTSQLPQGQPSLNASAAPRPAG